MHSSVVGRNGPIVYGVANEDYSDSNKATIDASTGVVTMHSAGLVRISVTFDDSPYIWYYNITVEQSMEGLFFIKNHATGTLLMPNDTSIIDQSNHLELRKMGQISTHKWELIYDGEGYYKIKNHITGNYVTSPTEATDGINVTAEPELSNEVDRQRWKIISNENETFTIRAQNRTSYVLSARKNSILDGTNVQQKSADSGEITEWIFANVGSFSNSGMSSRVFELRIDETTANNDTWAPLIHAAVAAWNNANAGVSITIVDSNSTSCKVNIVVEEFTPMQDPRNEKHGECHKEFSIDTGEIINATIRINSLLTSPNSAGMGVIVHEIGHLLWLDDNPPDASSIMRYDRNRNLIFLPQQSDIANVRFRYD